ncbi:MAG: polysaccharide deacetylase family protein [Rhodoferax sp.]|nr:polysaccharide deacetylase family protein [Rhodoferax sp.]NCS60934.1 polysaccharide deacetylase family protein [Rhodoferax sp.]OIP13284.1 MAG: hypothetical protein AUK50_13860 [Comamonadaceae bacterium CG2_30_57_122]PIZ23682.1 MAG: hypothetical protein COY49_02060 [Comamonadaceae bacterium CG_4_10_14_0_8_um_filter_57_29]
MMRNFYVGLSHLFRRLTWLSLACLFLVTPLNLVASPLKEVYLYASPITATFFAANGTSYDGLKQHWREYLRPLGMDYREVSRANLLAGLKPGVLVLGSAALLDEQERKAIEVFGDSGGSILMTWGTGVRDGRGKWVGYGLIEKIFQLKVNGKVLPQNNEDNNERFINTFGDGPLTWSMPAGERLFLGEVSEMSIRVDSPYLAARYFNWNRQPLPKNSNGAIAFLEKGASRRVYFGFSESSWEYDPNMDFPKLLNSVMAWLKHEPSLFKAAWPNGNLSAQLLEMDTEDKYFNAVNFASMLDAAKLRGTFYSLTSVARQYRDIVKQMSQKHEIGYHGEIHVGYKGKTAAVQAKRLDIMATEMKDIVGTLAFSKVTGFRAPTESSDEITDKILRKLGVQHNVTGPSSSEGRLPFFSEAEPALSTQEAIIGLPRTQMDDLNYLALRVSEEKAAELIMLDFDYLHEAGALGVVSVHSQNFASDDLMTRLMPRYIQKIQQFPGAVWTASGADIAAWWRARDRVIQRSAKGDATQLKFDVKAPGSVKGLTFMVVHAAAEGLPKAVMASGSGSPQPEIRRVDAYRTAIVFKDELKPGSYAYTVAF